MLIILFVSRQVLFGYDSQDRSVAKRNRAVVQAIAEEDRRADDHELRPALRRACDLVDRPARGLQEYGLAEKVGAGVSCYAELGKDDEIAIGCKVEDAHDFSRIGSWVGNGDTRRGTGYAEEAMSVHRSQARPVFHRACS